MSVSFDGNGLMESISVDGQEMAVTQNLMWYAAMNHGNSGDYFEDRASGAYVFRPNGTDAMPIATKATVTVQSGDDKKANKKENLDNLIKGELFLY